MNNKIVILENELKIRDIRFENFEKFCAELKEKNKIIIKKMNSLIEEKIKEIMKNYNNK